MYQMIFRFPMELKEILKSEAEKHGATLTGFMKQILWDWAKANMDKPKKEEWGDGEGANNNPPDNKIARRIRQNY